MKWDLKLDTGKVVQWDGDTGEHAAIRYVDAMRVAGKPVTVVASRRPATVGVFTLGGATIIG